MAGKLRCGDFYFEAPNTWDGKINNGTTARGARVTTKIRRGGN